MSVEVMAQVLHHSQAGGAAKLVLLGIANHQGDGGAWCSVSTLAKYAAVSERRVQQILTELEAAGEVIRELQAVGFGGNKTNRYWVNVACPEGCDRTPNHREGRSPLHPRGEARFTPGVKPASPKPLSEPSVEPEYAQDEPERALFDAFWENYPRKVGKKAAERAFALAVRRADQADIVAAALALACDPNLPPTQFVPYPATWLNRDGWNDEPYPERELTAGEKRERELAESARRSELARIHAQKLRETDEQAKAAATPPPRCVHGVNQVSCFQCLRAIKEGADPDTLIAE